ncbi:integrase catalytic domain-containing protein [Bradyrhizobium quebecense]|uniref:Transposase family protein n=2 Tax=Bradyrhizobium quebecense TaxID=2748629 RepID=A0ABS3MBX5_9BRAD|nr:DDE-type integrase/transposase/recombinase [Bradyrhizobium quebecense]UGY04317.1 transposase family protein [Bradyrhizobium quebecense]
MTTLGIKAGDIYEFSDGRHRFIEEWDDGTLWFVKETTKKRVPLDEPALVKMLDIGAARRIDIFRRTDGKPQSCNDNAEFGPGEEHSPDGVRARTFQWFVRRWDNTPGATLGKKGLAKFILLAKRDQPVHLDWPVKPERLYDAITKCGEPGNRPLRLFRSRRGKSQRKRFDRFVETALGETIVFYWDLRPRTFDDAFGFFRAKIAAENARRREAGEKEIEKYPRRPETIRRRINKTINRENWAKKYSVHEATLKFAGIKDSPTADSPLEIVIVDHTRADAWTVLDTTTGLPLRRPTLTIAIDVCTRIILGYVVTYEDPSIYNVMTCLKRVVRSKTYVPHVFPDIDYHPDAWDGWGLPEALLVDSGWEFKSPSFQDALRDVGIEPIWSPVHRPTYKAIGERFFHTFNQKLLHKIPGAVPWGPTEARLIDHEPRKEATISLGMLDELIHEAIQDYHLSEHASLDESPASAWKRKLKTRRIISDVHSLDALLGRTARVRFTRKGVKFRHQVFHDADTVSRILGPMSALAKRRDQSHSPVGSARCWAKIRYDDLDASCVRIWNDAVNPPRWETLPNRDRKFVYGLKIDGAQRDARRELPIPISFWHADQIREYAKKNGFRFRTDEEKWVARNKLRAKWEKTAGLLPLRETKDAIRGLAQSQGGFEQLVKVKSPPLAVEASQVVFATAPATPGGMARATLVPQQVAAMERETDEYFQPKARGPGRKGQAKAKRTARDKAEAAADERAEKAVERVKERARKAAAPKKAPAHEPEAKLERAVIDKYLDEE